MDQDPPQNAPVQQDAADIQGGIVNMAAAAPNDRIVLKWFVEFVQRENDWGYVENPGPSCEDHNKETERTDKNGQYYKQYINVDKDVDGEDHRHPEYDQYIQFQACVKWEDDQRNDSLEGREVEFTYTRKNGKGRPDQLANHNQKDGFGDQQPGNQLDRAKLARLTVDTDEGGWTPVIRFYLSRYGGDKFEIHAQAVVNPGGNASGQKLTIGTYEVWRKFWYQVTRPANLALPSLDSAKSAWAKVKVDIVKGSERTFDSNTAYVPAGTFYPKWQLKGGRSTDERVVIGSANRDDFYQQFVAEIDKPVQIHLIACHAQGDSRMSAVVTTGWQSRNSFYHKVDTGDWGAVVSPKLGGGDFMGASAYQTRSRGADGRWMAAADPIGLAANWFSVDIGRGSTSKVHIRLPPGVPAPNEQVRVSFTVQILNTFGGDSNGHHVICGKSTPWGLKDTDFFNSNFVHEIGHSFGQVPPPGQQSPSLPNHPFHHEQAGPHCKNGVPVLWRCVMFAGGYRMPTTFCHICSRHVRLKDMSGTGPVQ